MRRKATPDFWRAAWERRVAEVGVPTDTLASINWLGAIEQARAGDWAWLDDLVDRVTGDADDLVLAPPPDTWAVLDDFFSTPPPRTKGKKRRADRTVVEAIRYLFRELTTRPVTVVDAADRVVRVDPPMTNGQARAVIGDAYNLSAEAVRDIVRRRKTYDAE